MHYNNHETDAPVSATNVEPATSPKAEPDAKVKAFVKEWEDRILNAKEYWKPTFKRMRKCMEIAKFGDSKDWIGDSDENVGRYVVPIVKRHINQSVAQLYAKNPTSFAERKRRRMGTVWDGDALTLQQAMVTQQAAEAGMVPADPNAAAVIADAQAIHQHIRMMDGLADTLNILDEYFINEQAAGFKAQLKALVRRARVCGVGYVTLGYQRLLEARPEITGRITDVSQQIAHIKTRIAQAARDEIGEDSAKLEELERSLNELQAAEQIIVREGPVHGYPRSTQVIIDPCVTHLKTLTGANWWVEEWDSTVEDIEATWNVNVRDQFKKYTPDSHARPKWSDKRGKAVKEDLAKVWKVQDKRSGLEFIICEGYCGYLKEPAAPDVKIERFFTLFPLVFNEIEDEDEQIPPSDVWDTRHTIREYNAARQGLSEHRKQSKPGTYGPTSALNEADLKKLANRSSGDHLEIGSLSPGDSLDDKLKAIPTVQIDPKIYDVEPLYGDMLRTVGASAANQATTRGDTATETSIAEHSREVSDTSLVDDLDDLLSDLAKARGQLMLLELSRQTVEEIVGPGAVWPEMPQTREEIAKDLTLTIKAGSSGRPNKAAKLANMERGMPLLVQLGGVRPEPVAEEVLKLLDIDSEKALAAGLPSIVAQNAMAAKPTGQPGGGDPAKEPGAQGPKGGQNQKAPPQNEPGAQPAFPASAPPLA